MSGAPGFIFRFDAGPEVGGGHFMRQLALAQKARRRTTATMLIPQEAFVLNRQVDAGISAEALPAMSATAEVKWLLSRFAKSVFFIDSYRLPLDFYRRLSAAATVVAFEDEERELPASLVVKPRPSGGGAALAIADILEGCEYIPVREAFHIQASDDLVRRGSQAKKRLLVSFGAADPRGATRAMLRRLPISASSSWKLTVVAGPLSDENEHDPFGANALIALGWDVEVVRSPDMAALMKSVDAAIASAGSIVWELATLSVPTLVQPVADNQERNARLLHELGCVALADELDEFLSDNELRSDLAVRLHALVDGNGAQRVIDAVFERLL